jgi:mono/diheme cytochrome c family protein
VRQAAAWRAPNPGIVNGGVLSTGGGLVFQGDNDGRFNAYGAQDGRKLWSFDAQSAIMAAPITYSVKGRQYVTVLAGFGGAVALVGGEGAWGPDGPRRNRSRVLTFALDGAAPPLPPLAATRPGPIVAPPAVGDARMIAAGRLLYLNSCASCHGAGAKSAGVTPDLRRSGALTDAQAFYAVVGEGALAARGMASFRANYDAREIETIRAYLVARARQDAGGL